MGVGVRVGASWLVSLRGGGVGRGCTCRGFLGGQGGLKGSREETVREAERVSYLLGENFERLYGVAHCIGFKKAKRQEKHIYPGEKKASQLLGLLFMFSPWPPACQQVCACVFAYVAAHA